MSIYTQILIATDFSDINRLAIEKAVALAKQNQCQLTLLHVIEHFPMDGGPLSSVFNYNTDPDGEMAQHVRGRMQELVDSIGYDEIQAEFRITSKSARHEILRYAEVHNIDLIVVAPHGLGIIGTLGSTAAGVLNHASCDVLAVRQPG